MGVRKCSNFILLHVAVQFSQHHLLKRLFVPLYILASFVKNKVPIGAWVYFWVFYLVSLVYISIFVPVPYCLDDGSFVVKPEVRKLDSSSSILLSQDCFGYSEVFCVCEFLCVCVLLLKIATGDLTVNALNCSLL